MADYFTLTRVPDPDAAGYADQIVTAAVINCGLCGGVIAGMGGPALGAVCDHCANLLRSGKLRGLVERSTC